jgi:hypothetical protein
VVAGPPPDRGQPTAGRRFGRPHVRKALGWIALAGVVALPLFFLTPRSTAVRWQLSRARMETGYAPEAGIDLTRTGNLENSSEVAFEVTARDAAGELRDDLPPDQRWRGTSYFLYESGRWKRSSPYDRVVRSAWSGGSTRTGIRLPDLGPDSMVLDFRLIDRVRGTLLADPVVYDPAQSPPLLYEVGGRRFNGIQTWDGSFIPPVVPAARVNRYQQAYRLLDDRNAGVPFVRERNLGEFDPVIASLLDVKSEDVRGWSRRLLDRLIADGKLPAEVNARRHDVTQHPHPQDFRAVAEAFRGYLADSGEFQYTLTLTRQDRTRDPIDDFLFNTKAGHCERFATALVLMLRSVGIPSIFVLGFKGCESLGDGKYLVRQEHTHAWVEAMVPAGGADVGKWQWVSLDPTPSGGDDAAAGGVVGLWGFAKQTGRRFFADYIIGLNPDSQQRITESAWEAVTSGKGLAVAAVASAVVGLLWLRRRNRRLVRIAPVDTGTDAVPWFTRLVALLTQAGYPLPSGVTPREYARGVAEGLAGTPLAAVADVPVRVAELVYEARYAGQALPADRVSAAEWEIDRLASALALRPG